MYQTNNASCDSCTVMGIGGMPSSILTLVLAWPPCLSTGEHGAVVRMPSSAHILDSAVNPLLHCLI